MSFLNSPLSQFSMSVADCYRMHLYHTLKMAKLGFLCCVTSWLMFNYYNQQYTYWATFIILVEVIFIVIMLVRAYLKKRKFFYILLLTISYATMKFWWQCEDGNMRRAGWGQQHEDGWIRLAVAAWWHYSSGVMTVVLNFYLIVFFNSELMSFLNSPLSQFSISVTDCYHMHLYHTLEMAKGEFLFCVASWLMFDCYNQQYTYWTTLII